MQMQQPQIHRFQASTVEVEEVAALDVTGLLEQLKRLFRSTSWTPPVPPSVAMKVIALSNDKDANAAKIAALFQQDPMLSARVLRVAKSPLFGSSKLTSIHDAIVRIGLRQMQAVVLEAALELRVFHSEAFGPWMELIRKHSVATAHAARLVAKEFGVDPESAFVAGLLHDVGSAAALGAIGDRPGLFPNVDTGALAAAMDDLHGEVGGIVAEAWKMPAEIHQLVSHHHHVHQATSPNRLLAVLVVSETLATLNGFGVMAEGNVNLDPSLDDDVSWACQVLGVDGNRMQRLVQLTQPVLALL
jgi:putative nucleotidyltransferase with HDIG domain